MATLSANSRTWLKAIFGEERLRYIESEAATLSQKEAEQLVTQLKDKVNDAYKDKPAQHPGMLYWGTSYKSTGTTPTIAELTAKSKALSARIRQTAIATKDAQESAEAQSVRELLDLAYQLDLNENAVLQLVREYSMSEVMTILRTLCTVKSTGKGFKSVFFGVTTDSPDISDVSMALKQTSGRDPFFS